MLEQSIGTQNRVLVQEDTLGATDELMEEHRTVERMIAVLEEAAQRLEQGERVRPGLLREAVDFLSNFVDRSHHGKEEGHLFPRLQAAGVPREGGPLAVMLFEHEEGRDYIRAINDAVGPYESGDAAAAAARIAEAIRGYADLLHSHIWKEENVLFPMADGVLGAEDHEDLARRFHQLEAEVMGPGELERYHRIVDDLEAELGLA